jgi:hypothetical protein
VLLLTWPAAAGSSQAAAHLAAAGCQPLRLLQLLLLLQTQLAE